MEEKRKPPLWEWVVTGIGLTAFALLFFWAFYTTFTKDNPDECSPDYSAHGVDGCY